MGLFRRLNNLTSLEDTSIEAEMLDTVANGPRRLRVLLDNRSLDREGNRRYLAQGRDYAKLADQCLEVERRKEEERKLQQKYASPRDPLSAAASASKETLRNTLEI